MFLLWPGLRTWRTLSPLFSEMYQLGWHVRFLCPALKRHQNHLSSRGGKSKPRTRLLMWCSALFSSRHWESYTSCGFLFVSLKKQDLFSACCVQKMSLSIGNFYVTNPYVPVQCPVFLFILSCRRRVSQKAVSMSQTHTVCAYAASKRTVPRQCPPFSSFFFPTQESKTSTSVFLQKAWLNDYVLSSSLCLGCWATKGLSACSDNPALLKINPL